MGRSTPRNARPALAVIVPVGLNILMRRSHRPATAAWHILFKAAPACFPKPSRRPRFQPMEPQCREERFPSEERALELPPKNIPPNWAGAVRGNHGHPPPEPLSLLFCATMRPRMADSRGSLPPFARLGVLRAGRLWLASHRCILGSTAGTVWR